MRVSSQSERFSIRKELWDNVFIISARLEILLEAGKFTWPLIGLGVDADMIFMRQSKNGGFRNTEFAAMLRECLPSHNNDLFQTLRDGEEG